MLDDGGFADASEWGNVLGEVGPDGRWRAVPDEEWHQIRGISLQNRTGGVLIEPNQEALDRIQRTGAAIDSLGGDLDKAISTADPSTTQGSNMMLLQVQYAGFEARWEGFRVAVDDNSSLGMSLLTLNSQLDAWESEYADFRARFVALGGRPVGNIHPPTTPGVDLMNKAVSMVPWIVAGLAIYFLAPVVVPIATGLLATHRAKRVSE